MPDKDDFTFEENDHSEVESDFSNAFDDQEQQASPSPEPEMPKPDNDPGSRPRTFLVILLVVVAIAGGVFYFMDLGGTAPEVSTTPPKAQETVAAPPKPLDEEKSEPVTAQEEAAKVPVPPPAPAADVQSSEPVGEPGPQPSEPEKAGSEAALAETSEKKPSDQAEAPATGEEVKQVSTGTTVEASGQEVAAIEEPVPPPPPAPVQDDHNYTLDAGSYLLERNRLALVKKIRSLGYEPEVSSVDAKVNMVRLRLGAFSADEAQQALDYAKKISPTAFSLPQGDQHVIYAGTFFQRRKVDELRERFRAEGMAVESEPVEVTRTLSRVRFGHFANRDEAVNAATKVSDAGVEVTVIRGK